MIYLKKDRTAIIPENERLIGYKKDNLIEERLFAVNDKSLFDMYFYLDVENPEDIISLSVHEKTEDLLILKWEIGSDILTRPGILKVQLRASDSSLEKIWHSSIMEFTVSDSLDTTENLSDAETLTEIEQFERRMQVAVLAVTASEDTAKSYAESAEEAAEKAKEYADYTAANAGKEEAVTGNTVTLSDGCTFNAGSKNALTVQIGEGALESVISLCELLFVSGTTATVFTAAQSIAFKGEDCYGGIFIPAANKTYSVLFGFNGVGRYGLVLAL